jgi:hypothetical protein
MLISIQQPEFFPWLGFFNKISQVEKVVILDSVQFKKRYFENRNKIRTSQDWCWIRAPVKVKGRYTQLIQDVEIDDSQNWRHTMAESIRHGYANAPHWGEGGDELCDLIVANHSTHLAEFNLQVISFLMRRFRLERPMVMASSIGTNSSGSQLILDICKATGASAYLSGRDGRDYLEEQPFKTAGIALYYQEFIHPTYAQFHGQDFLPAMSAIDVLFNIGAGAASEMIAAAGSRTT